MSTPLHGVMAEFGSVTELVAAIHAAHSAGYTVMDAYLPFPSEEVAEALALPASPLPWVVLLGGIAGGLSGYGMQVYAQVFDYPVNIGGRPLHAWPYLVPITFECTILGAALAAVFGMLALSRLPAPYHPAFNDEAFALASRDAFFLCIEATDPRFERMEAAAFLVELEARHVAEVPL